MHAHNPHSHLLKFVDQGRTFNPNVGIKTYPRQTYGVSQESPEEFKGEHTLIGEHGYSYRHQFANEFEYPSQARYFDIHNSVHLGDATELPQRLMANSLAFHRKKGRLSQFMDKNGWMSPILPMMGHERTSQARALSNRDKQIRINSLKPKVIYQNTQAKKAIVNPQYFNTISVLMSQKLRIRKKRQDLMKGQVPAAPRPVSQQLVDPLHIENVEDKLAKTTKDFYSTTSTFRSRNANSQMKYRAISSKQSKYPSRIGNRAESYKIREESYRVSSPAKSRNQSSQNYRTLSPSKENREEQKLKANVQGREVLEVENMKLQQWYRTTCNSKWRYNPKQLDSEQREQQIHKMQVSNRF